jgi:rRNA-processing protein FCF1
MRNWAVLDANLLLLLIVGRAAPPIIARHKRLQHYRTDDYDSLVRMLGLFDEIIIVPQVLAEVSNLGRHIRDPDRSSVFGAFGRTIAASLEQWIPSASVIHEDYFQAFGLTDAVLIWLCLQESDDRTCTLVTSDQPLADRAASLGCRVLDYRDC